MFSFTHVFLKCTHPCEHVDDLSHPLLVPYRFVTGGDYSFLLFCLSVCLSVPIPSCWFSRLFFLLLADIHLIFGTLLCHTKLQIKFEFGFNPFISQWVMALGLRKCHILSVFRTFFSLFAVIHLIFGTLLCHTKLQINFEFGFNPFIFDWVMALRHWKFHILSVFRTFFLTVCRYSFEIW